MTTQRPRAVPIDLSSLPPPQLLQLDYEALLAARRAGLVARLDAAGIAYDVGRLESDPAMILQQEDAYRQLLDHASINDMATARTLGFARGADLDWLAATFYADLGLARLSDEDDTRFERRILLAAEGLAGALTAGGIVYHALSISTDVVDAVSYQTEPGRMRLALLARAGIDADALRRRVEQHFTAPHLRGSAALSFALAREVPVTIDVRLRHGPGPDPSVLRLAAVAALDEVKARIEGSIGAVLTVDEVIARGRVGGVSKIVIEEPAHDADPGIDGVLRITSLSVMTEQVPSIGPEPGGET